ncbi:MAG: response regulator [Chloroflexi bacterium]|nr:response regulator [Chloroflexota bacterium]
MAQRILIIEDNPKNARLMRRVLEKANYQILHAESGEAGLELAIDAQPDLILLDLGLPDVDGQVVAGMLKQPGALPETPVIVVTAWPQETAMQMVAAYNCEGYIPKPIDTRTFIDQVARYLPQRP